MPLVIVISSYVAASRVGGGLAPYVLAPMKVDPIHVPTTLLGRHPGWGPPGGGMVEPAIMAGMLDAIEANGLFSLCDAVLTGYFASPEQVAVAAEAIDRIRAAPRNLGGGPAHDHAPPRPLVVVDPIMGDASVGRYVRADVAEAIIRELVPRADLTAGNLWEFQAITGSSAVDPADVARDAIATGRDWLVSSIETAGGAQDRIGALLAGASGAMLADAAFLPGVVPRGTGDLLKLRHVGGLVSGLSPVQALSLAVGATAAVIEKSMAWRAGELPVAACQDVLTDPPLARVTPLDLG